MQNSKVSATTELELALRMIWMGRLLLLRAETEAALLYARVLWRMAELRYVVYQVALGDVEVDRKHPTLPVTVRAAEQMLEKLKVLCGTSPGNVGLYADSSDTLVVLLDLLSRQLSYNILDPHENNVVTRRALSENTVLDWYVKLTFIIGTLENSSIKKKVTTLGFPDLKPSLPEANYTRFEKTHLLSSLNVLRVEKEDAAHHLELRDVGELIAVAAAGKLHEMCLQRPGNEPEISSALTSPRIERNTEKEVNKSETCPSPSKAGLNPNAPVFVPRSYAAAVKGC